MKDNLLALLLLFFVVVGTAQEQRQIITGRIIAESYTLHNILVVNVPAEREVRTDSLGNFRLAAKTGDVLQITDISIIPVQVTVGKDFMPGGVIAVQLTQAFELDQVVVEGSRITAESLGIVAKGQKIYTPAERKLYTAGDFKPIHLISIIAGGMPLDPVFNAINGRTKMLKKAVNVEKKETALASLDGLFTDGEIIEQFKIPKDYIQGFLFFCVEDQEYLAAVESGNETLINFRMGILAANYLELLSDEK